MRDGFTRERAGAGDLHARQADRLSTREWNASGVRPGPRAAAALLAFTASGGWLFHAHPHATTAGLQAAAWGLFGVAAGLRLTALALSRATAPVEPLPESDLPTYTIIAPLYREAPVVRQLVRALSALDYPADRLQVLFVLEADDGETLTALAREPMPTGFEVFVAPPGSPQTKPRACNEALARARGDYVVIYDAEDRPHPAQLKEAAARFTRSPEVACFQAPLRVDGADTFLQRQFALEYAAQFEVLLPCLHRLGVPFPLGGSSNHFRRSVLERVGGWDPYNVTEDADLGFRLAAAGLRTGLLSSPTVEQAPDTLEGWTPQRARWLKGHLQTWCVHVRRPAAGGWRRLLALQATLGLGLVSAFGHGPLMLLLMLSLLQAAVSTGEAPQANLAVLAAGWAVSLATMRLGARRAGAALRLRDALGAPVYWPLHSYAALRACRQLITRPYHWDKTEHRPSAA